MNTSLLLTAFLMGLFGGPHCLAMCGATCVGISRANSLRGPISVAQFQLGRVIGYSSLGAIGAFSVQSVGWLSIHSSLFRPVWGLFHVCALLIGLFLILKAEQPLWLDTYAQDIWRRVVTQKRVNTLPLIRFGPLFLGVLWALLPCGLLYSALWVAALSANPFEGALVMANFTLGSALVLSAGPWVWRILKSADVIRVRLNWRQPNSFVFEPSTSNANTGNGAWGVRLAGVALVSVSAFALWHGLVQNAAPWCVGVSYNG